MRLTICLFFTSAVFGGGVCPETHPYPYGGASHGIGSHCCATNRENVYEPSGVNCDGSIITETSECCENNEGVQCPNPPCSKPGSSSLSWVMDKTSMPGHEGGDWGVTLFDELDLPIYTVEQRGVNSPGSLSVNKAIKKITFTSDSYNGGYYYFTVKNDGVEQRFECIDCESNSKSLSLNRLYIDKDMNGPTWTSGLTNCRESCTFVIATYPASELLWDLVGQVKANIAQFGNKRSKKQVPERMERIAARMDANFQRRVKKYNCDPNTAVTASEDDDARTMPAGCTGDAKTLQLLYRQLRDWTDTYNNCGDNWKSDFSKNQKSRLREVRITAYVGMGCNVKRPEKHDNEYCLPGEHCDGKPAPSKKN